MTDAQRRQVALGDVDRERERQNRIHGEGEANIVNRGAAQALPALVEEVGEVARAMVERDHEAYRTELIHVAAVAVAMVEAHDKREQEARR